jgi:predicted metal-dependent peptidase
MNLHLIVVDVEINSYKVYTKGDVIDKSYKGAGGTDLRVAFDYILEKGINPTVVVCLTDGETPFPEHELYPTLWVITPYGRDFDKIPFGQKVRIDEE